MCQLSFTAKIHGVKMNHRRVVVLLQQRIHIFDIKTMKALHTIDRVSSPWADPSLAWLCTASERGYLATPLASAAHVTVWHSAPRYVNGLSADDGGAWERGQGQTWRRVGQSTTLLHELVGVRIGPPPGVHQVWPKPHTRCSPKSLRIRSKPVEVQPIPVQLGRTRPRCAQHRFS